MRLTLPIHKHLPDITFALGTAKRAVVQAPPGAGKTTRVPLALLEADWLDDKKIILLEPRRLAAISCAAHMAGLLNEKTGQTVGYQIRLDRKKGPDTRIEVVTEGIFTRRIQADPSLADVGIVIFDEFHERNLQSDLGLALCLETAEVLRPDLCILIMSATMDTSAVSALMGNAPVITSQGKSFPVETRYLSWPARQNRPMPIETACALAIRQALSETSGDMLVFLPGVKEIKTLQSILKKEDDPGLHVYPLYGNLSLTEQAAAFRPSAPEHRKIVIATSIAETSLTIDGVSVVIDAGLMRVPRFSSQTGMTRLETLRVSKASADQRRGRAGRTQPGMCLRLWSEYDHQSLQAYTKPEILSIDLTGTALELAAWGVSDPEQLNWLDPPDEKAFDRAKTLLKTMGALDRQGHITAHGRKMVSAGLHPRLSHMVISADEKGHGMLACRIAAFLAERDFIRFEQGLADPDIRLRLEIIETFVSNKKRWQNGIRINKGILHRIIQTEKKMAKDFNLRPAEMDIEKTGTLLAYAYPDRIAKKRDNSNSAFLLATGKGAFFTGINTVSLNEYIVAAHLDGTPKNAKIFLAAPYPEKDFEQDFCDCFKTSQTVFWDKKACAVRAKEETLFENLVVRQQSISEIDPQTACDILIQVIQKQGLDLLPWTKKLKNLKERTVFLKHIDRFQDLPDLSDTALEQTMDVWLKPFLTGIFSLKQLGKIDLDSALFSLLTWKDQKTIEKNAPTHITVPSGSKKPLTYRNETGLLDSPVLEVRLQEMFGLTETPKIAGHRIPVTLHLLSPASRPVQITTDLKSFWKNTYKNVKKDLKGRYPKHFWPEDPLLARPTNRVKPKNR